MSIHKPKYGLVNVLPEEGFWTVGLACHGLHYGLFRFGPPNFVRCSEVAG